MTYSRERWGEHEAWGGPEPRPARRALPGARPIRVGVAVEERCLSEREPTALVARLTARGHAVELLDPEEAGRDPDLAGERVSELDVVVARGGTPALLALLAKAERLGVPVLNRPAAIAAVQDGWTVARVLEEGRVPTPPRTSLAPPDAPAGRGLALHVAGGSVYAIRGTSPRDGAGGRSAPAQRVELTAEMRALALRCGALLGLDVYGLACVESEQGLVVVEVNDFPNFSGLDEADERLVDLVVARAFAAAASRNEP